MASSISDLKYFHAFCLFLLGAGGAASIGLKIDLVLIRYLGHDRSTKAQLSEIKYFKCNKVIQVPQITAFVTITMKQTSNWHPFSKNCKPP